MRRYAARRWKRHSSRAALAASMLLSKVRCWQPHSTLCTRHTIGAQPGRLRSVQLTHGATHAKRVLRRPQNRLPPFPTWARARKSTAPAAKSTGASGWGRSGASRRQHTVRHVSALSPPAAAAICKGGGNGGAPRQRLVAARRRRLRGGVVGVRRCSTARAKQPRKASDAQLAAGRPEKNRGTASTGAPPEPAPGGERGNAREARASETFGTEGRP